MPLSPAATHNDVEGQEIARNVLPPFTFAPLSDQTAPAGSVDQYTKPALSVATHNVVLGQEIAFIAEKPLTPTGSLVQPAGAPVGSVDVRTFEGLVPSTATQRLGDGHEIALS